MFTYVIVIITTYRKHQQKDYPYKRVQIVCTATKLKTSMYCNYNSWQITAFYRLYCITNYNDHICENFNPPKMMKIH
jgi:hypothetical protein